LRAMDIYFLLFRSAPSSSATSIRESFSRPQQRHRITLQLGSDEPCKICGDTAITGFSDQGMKIYFCLDRGAVLIQGPGLFVFDVLG
jgi:peroxiredoxin